MRSLTSNIEYICYLESFSDQSTIPMWGIITPVLIGSKQSIIAESIELNGVFRQYAGKPALLVGLALVRGLNVTSLLHGIFLALLAGLDIARMRSRRPALLSVLTWRISSPPREFTGRRDFGKKGQHY